MFSYTHSIQSIYNFKIPDWTMRFLHCAEGSKKRQFHLDWYDTSGRKDSREGSLDRVLFVAVLEFPKIAVPRLRQNTSNINIECAG